MTETLYPVVLTGGLGTRLWPLSRAALPKQLLPLVSSRTMLQETVARLDGVPDMAGPVVICNEIHRFLAAEQLLQNGVAPHAIILEPEGRSTAPALAVAALALLKTDANALMLVLSADQFIADIDGFHAAIDEARACARAGYLATFGIKPTAPETGFGYLWRGAPLTSTNAALPSNAFAVREFIEKPTRERAIAYGESGEHFWNSGMFLFRADVFLRELGRYASDIEAACRQAFETARRDDDFLRLGEEFLLCRSESVDYAVMEKTNRAAMIPCDIGWNDIGSFAALWDYLAKDENQNVLCGDVETYDTQGCLIQSQSRLVAAVGVQNLVIVETSDAILVMQKDKSQDVKKLVDKLRANNRNEL